MPKTKMQFFLPAGSNSREKKIFEENLHFWPKNKIHSGYACSRINFTVTLAVQEKNYKKVNSDINDGEEGIEEEFLMGSQKLSNRKPS